MKTNWNTKAKTISEEIQRLERVVKDTWKKNTEQDVVTRIACSIKLVELEERMKDIQAFIRETQPKNGVAKWETHLWLDGRSQKRKEAGASTARQLYCGHVWHGTLTGMTNETEQLILNALNQRK